MKAKVVEWRDTLRDRPRAADIGVTVLRALLKFGELSGKVHHNVAAGIPSLYRGGDRAEIIWTEEDLEAFTKRANELGLAAVADGLRLAAATGLRREDLVTLTQQNVDDFAIVKKAHKRSGPGRRRRFASIPRVPELDSLLEQISSRSRQSGVTTILVDPDGRPWTPDRLTKAVGKIRDQLDIVHVDPETGQARKKHLHDARGTYATRLMVHTDLDDAQIADIMGWAPEEVTTIRKVYVDQTAVMMAIGQRINRGTVNRSCKP